MDNSIHNTTILMENMSFTESDTSLEERGAAGERQEVLVGVGQHVGANYREQDGGSD